MISVFVQWENYRLLKLFGRLFLLKIKLRKNVIGIKKKKKLIICDMFIELNEDADKVSYPSLA